MKNSTNDKHQQRMQKLKEKVDARIDQAQDEKGLVIAITGNGKGKTTSGFGTITRAVGHGLKAAVVQFIKGTWASGEKNLLAPHGVTFDVMATGFTWDTQDKEADIAAAKIVWEAAKKHLSNPVVDIVLLDEITYMVSFKYLDLEDIINTIKQRPVHQHVVITGRACHRELIELADTVSEVHSIKHAFDSGIKAQQGVDW
jgi:cob(I)alamin adenosyltransferase